VDARNPAPVENGRLSHNLLGLQPSKVVQDLATIDCMFLDFRLQHL
jgi:hypothetical protein